MNPNIPVYLKQQTKIEPLTCGWYAWPYLIAPAQLAMNLSFRLLPLMQSFVANPATHVAACSDPKMYGGPFMSLTMEDVSRVAQLMEDTRRRCTGLLTFAEDLKRFTALLEAEAKGYSLNGFYARLPESLRGLVECLYDTNDHAHVRLFEDLVYDENLTAGTQEILLQLTGEQERHFFMSTPRLDAKDSLRFAMDFSDRRLDVLASMRTQPRPLAEIEELFAVREQDREVFAGFFTTTPPALNGTPRYAGDGVRMRYFGHACVLLETSATTVLFDPMVAFERNDDGRFTCADLPEFIDYVVLTHSHQDHFCAEMLIQLRHRIGRVVVPGNNSGNIADPSMKLLLQSLGFEHIDVLDAFERVPLPDGEILSLPFTGEHADLSIHSKHAIALTLEGRKLLFLIDSDGVDGMLYRRLMRRVGAIDALFLGMECHGAPLAWLYEPLLGKPVSRKNNESRRLSGADCARASTVLSEVQPPRVFVYAMGQEPWLQYMMGLKYEPDSIQLVESDKLLEQCRQAGIEAERLYLSREIEFPAVAATGMRAEPGRHACAAVEIETVEA
jgi:L-ascorbate metabolism protein UlaG (beta-lactamase superfamily)